MLAGVADVVSAAWQLGNGLADVPFVHPTEGDVERLVWDVAEGLAVVHRDERFVMLVEDEDEEAGVLEQVLDLSGARRLLQVVASCHAWQDELTECARAAGWSRRVERLQVAQRARWEFGGDRVAGR